MDFKFVYLCWWLWSRNNFQSIQPITTNDFLRISWPMYHSSADSYRMAIVKFFFIAFQIVFSVWKCLLLNIMFRLPCFPNWSKYIWCSSRLQRQFVNLINFWHRFSSQSISVCGRLSEESLTLSFRCVYFRIYLCFHLKCAEIIPYCHVTKMRKPFQILIVL